MKRLLILLLILAVAAPASAGFLDKLKKFTDENSKEGRILAGATAVLSSSQEIDYSTERTIGEGLALEGLQRYGKPVANEELQRYVNLVGNAVARNGLRSTIPYQFVVVESPLQNAFACPGGIIFISSALLDLLADESELAAILAHEVGHVGNKHAISSTRRAQFLEGVGKITAATMRADKGKKVESLVGDLQNILFDKGLDQGMEYEADRSALETAYRTGYDPEGLLRVLKKLQKLEASSEKKGSWFGTHPPLAERISRIEGELAKYGDRDGLAKVASRFSRETGHK